ncbi:MAG: peptide deformylase [Rickettsiales bacterium TMED254]|nr:peptide deformylase [Rickettsiales bacterium]RPF77289.1 MAG: peptide deformylase [Rickettsiales bacterium TMED254]|tara:strand:+ start:220 stop:810 length:591 start_codon:yes stop_codon:yes gene_type:complete
MAVLQILKMGHPFLRKKAAKVTDFINLKNIFTDMQDTLEFVGGSGLAANQVMINKRIILYRIRKDRIPEGANFNAKSWTFMINPVMKPLSKEKELYWERCLSIPGLHGKVPRYKSIIVQYYTTNKKLIEFKAESTWAALLQHEFDHLDGILYPMRMRDLSKLGFNDYPGEIEKDMKKNKKYIDPLFLNLVKRWKKK